MPTINKRGIDTIMSLKKKIAAAFIACAMTLVVVPSAFACTALYVGSDLTEDGTTMFGRIEDLGTNDYNKLFNISPAGKHTAGEVYEGCYGFTYTFTHDSYRYTARRDDNGLGVCPDCDSTHEHTAAMAIRSPQRIGQQPRPAMPRSSRRSWPTTPI